MLIAINPLYVLSGFLVGFLVGQTGVGGGSLMTPLLVLLFNINPVTAVAPCVREVVRRFEMISHFQRAGRRMSWPTRRSAARRC
jgi:hypothetical protein